MLLRHQIQSGLTVSGHLWRPWEEYILLIGLSKNERPILDHHAKAHNFEIRRIHEMLGHSPHPAFIKLKSFCCYKVLGGFHMKSGWNPLDFTGEICWISRVKSARFHGWNPPDFERPIARNGKPYVLYIFEFYPFNDKSIKLMQRGNKSQILGTIVSV